MFVKCFFNAFAFFVRKVWQSELQIVTNGFFAITKNAVHEYINQIRKSIEQPKGQNRNKPKQRIDDKVN